MKAAFSTAFAAFILAAAAVPAAYQTGFEPPLYTVGDLHGQDGWAVQGGSASVQTSAVHTGLQAVAVGSGGFVTRPVGDDGSSVVWVESYLRATPSVEPMPDTTPRSASIYFDQALGIMCLDGDGAGGGSWTAAGVPAAAGSWYRVTIRLDFVFQIWDCYIDGVLRLTNLGFKDNSVTGLAGVAARAQSGGTTYVDDVLVQLQPPAGIADADGDGLPDDVEDPNPPAAGASNRFLADSDGDGLSDAVEDWNRNGARDGNETSARDADSDDDGAADGIEVLILGTDPLDPGDPPNAVVDADKDTLPAGYDLDDADPDVDGDGIDDGFEAVRSGVAASGDPLVTPPLGDVNLDGAASNLDALIVQTLFLGLLDFHAWPGATNGDPDADGALTNLDALIVQTYFLDLLARLPLRR